MLFPKATSKLSAEPVRSLVSQVCMTNCINLLEIILTVLFIEKIKSKDPFGDRIEKFCPAPG